MPYLSSLKMLEKVATDDSLVSRIGIYLIILASITGLMDHFELVHACPYCQTQRAVIGLFGFIMLFRWSSLLGVFTATIFGAIGIHVACAQIFLAIKEHKAMYVFLHDMNAHMALGTLIILFGSYFVLLFRFYRHPE